jgi:hypothetical protein
LREAAARAWPLALQRLRNPRLRFSTGYLFSEDKNQLAAWRKLAQQAGFEEDPVSWSLRLAYCPAVHHPEQDAFRALQPYLISTVWSAWLVSLTEEFQQLVERLTAPLPAGVYETDPRVSAPSLLPQVEARLGVSQEAAVLYLQMLALARPTTKNLQLWNGWEARQIKAAAAELVSQGLLLEAKRARAGREHFLPGGWEALKAPELPLETWKLPLYQLPTSPPAFLLNRVLSVRPLGLTFERAWQRIVQGDTPGYDESKALRKER